MGIEFYKESYSGKVREITLGKGDKAVTVGGETAYPFYLFEGDMPKKPKIAMEIWDMEPDDWAPAAVEPFKDVLSDPAAWAKKCVSEYGAELIVLQMRSTDPNGKNTSPSDAAETVKKTAEAIDVPLIVWGTANVQKDEEVFKVVSEKCQGMNLIIGPVEDANHKGIGASAMGYGHTIISSSPIDVNLAKQVNILLENLGVSNDKILVDPTSGGLGYGLEYSYSVMERLRQAALTQGDEKLQYPIINNLANEVWKSKEAKQPVDEAPTLGDPERRGVLMEAVCAVTYLLSGGDILIMRHPEAIRMVKTYIDLMIDGGSAGSIAAIQKRLDEPDIDYAALSPEPDLTIEEEEKKPAAKPAAKPAPEAKPAAEAKPEPAPAEAKPEPAPAEAKTEEDEAAKAKKEAEAKKKAEEDAEAKKKAAAESKAKEEAEAKKKAEEEAKVKAEAEAKAKEEAAKKAAADAAAKREAEEEEIRNKRAEERQARMKERKEPAPAAGAATAEATQKTKLDKMIEQLDRIHRRHAA